MTNEIQFSEDNSYWIVQNESNRETEFAAIKEIKTGIIRFQQNLFHSG
jgi:hypothetical protein